MNSPDPQPDPVASEGRDLQRRLGDLAEHLILVRAGTVGVRRDLLADHANLVTEAASVIGRQLSEFGPNQFDDDGNEYVPLAEHRAEVESLKAERDEAVQVRRESEKVNGDLIATAKRWRSRGQAAERKVEALRTAIWTVLRANGLRSNPDTAESILREALDGSEAQEVEG